eukprot:gnl/MRDRNA2_/MRDRNA2_99567_c0_seq1.p1 gnl/MRDRNA2_/MRDRNA2_99567_c0~~gnl/MRDRNA2_/MRDRNA2_99567_c0_seq1.p1  ORF type:complete len:224 (-),score=77.18 gnl/MRDRNA2_/MRDRNA2_99567_c0_seq1:69-740(-)
MAPTMAANRDQLLLNAVQKLATATTDTGRAPTEFSKKLLELMELSAKIQQFEEVAALASEHASSDEVQKWQEISLMTVKHCSAQLVEQQQKAVAELQELAKNGGSLFTEPGSSAALSKSAVKPPPGLESVGAPPGLQAPKGIGAPPGLSAPPGLGLQASKAPVQEKVAMPKEQAPAVKKAWSAASAPWNQKKKASPQITAQKQPEMPDTAAPCVMNLDAYDSD